MTLANLSLTNTFLDQLTKLNQVLVIVNNLTDGQTNSVGTIYLTNATGARGNVTLEVANGMIKGDGGLLSNLRSSSLVSNTINLVSNSASITVSGGLAQLGGTNYINVSTVTGVTDNSVSNLATGLFLSNTYSMASSGNLTAIGAFAQANATATLQVTIFNQANTANATAIAAFAQSNTYSNLTNFTVGTLSTARLATATATQYKANSSTNVLTPDQLWISEVPVVLTDAATVVVDMSTFINGTLTLAGNRTLGQPTNTKVGQQGYIRIIQDATGSRTLAYHADWKFSFGSAPTLTTTAGATDIMYYQVIASNFIYGNLVKDVR